jgi:glycosyltransferase involved in cell wall biosynthesis
MTRVLLINQEAVPHFRVPVYGYLSRYLERRGICLTVAAEGIDIANGDEVEFEFAAVRLSARHLIRLIRKRHIDVVVSWVDIKHLFLFPTYLAVKILLRKKMIYWGQGRDLMDRRALLKNLIYAAEHALCDAIILYAEHLKKYVQPCFRWKVFVANNTLCVPHRSHPRQSKANVLGKYGIRTPKNVICVGRMQKRKRIGHLVEALRLMNRSDVGLILLGPGDDGTLREISDENIYKLGPIYGDEKYDLLAAADVFCLPGAVGLSIVDAFHCGLPFITEEGDESAEIMYLKDGRNGFFVPKGDSEELARKLLVLLDDDALRANFSSAARMEMAQSGHIDRLCEGFLDSILYVTGESR